MRTLNQIGLVRKLEVVHKQVGGRLISHNLQPTCKAVRGYLTRCARIAASIALVSKSFMNDPVTQDGWC